MGPKNKIRNTLIGTIGTNDERRSSNIQQMSKFQTYLMPIILPHGLYYKVVRRLI